MNSDTLADKHSMTELIFGVVMISLSAVFVKIAHVGPNVAGFYRMAFGTVFLLGIALATQRQLWGSWRAFLPGFGTGFIFAADLAFWHRSIYSIGPGLATVMGNFQVFFLAAFGMIILKERPGILGLLAIPLALFGLYLIVGVKWDALADDYKLGLLFGIITAIFYASYLLTLRKIQSHPDSPTPLLNITSSSIGTTVAMGLLALVMQESFSIGDTQTLVALVSYGLCGQVLGWVLITRSIKFIPASRVGLILLLQPTCAFIWDVLFFHRQTQVTDVIGAVIALAAIYLGTPKRTTAPAVD
jgi:drug/metabolite transporter (DMT)-like permease